MARSRCRRTSRAWPVPIAGIIDGMSMIAPSFSGGMNSLPSRLQGRIVASSTRTAGVLASAGVVLHPAVGAVLMSASTVIVALNAQLLRRASL